MAFLVPTFLWHNLEGRRIMCHCRPDQQCHGDVLIEAFAHHAQMMMDEISKDPPTDDAIIGEAEARRAGVTGSTRADFVGRTAPTRVLGDGVPLYVYKGAARRLLSEGGGLCSAGLWPPNRRFEPEGGSNIVRDAFIHELSQLDTRMLLGKLISGSIVSDPFPTPATARLRDVMRSVAHKVEAPADAQPQPIDVHLLHGLLLMAGDPDAMIMPLFQVGVPIGVGMDLPRTDAVFPPKVRWSLKEQPDWGGDSLRAAGFKGKRRENYPSAELFASEVEAALEDQASRGQIMILPFSEATRRYGDRLTIASLAALEKSTDSEGKVEVRIIHDGTNGVDVNRYIKVQDGGCSPTAADIKRVLQEQRASGAPHFGLTLDVKEAHRMVAVRPEDWPLQACQVRRGGVVYLNTRGTYGVSSAAYWWGRLAAALHRLILAILGQRGPWAKLFADDWDLSAGGPGFEFALLAFAWMLVCLGVPLSWKKARGGFVYNWVGLEVDLRSWSLGISSSRASWLIGWFDRILDSNRVLMRELREALGRMVFVYGALKADKPFLAPLFAFLGTRPAGSCVELPLFVRMILEWLRSRLKIRRSQVVPIAPANNGAIFRVDAKAEGMAVAIGGWAPVLDQHGVIDIKLSKWFSIRLTPEDAPWAFSKGLPARSISALELLASTAALVLLSPATLPGKGTVVATGVTDSQVASSVVAKGMSTTYPLCCVAMELAAQQEARGLELGLQWAPREFNAEADALADGRVDGFDPRLRVGTDLASVKWMVLPALLEAGGAFYKSLGKRPLVEPGGKPAKALAGQRLRDREPW